MKDDALLLSGARVFQVGEAVVVVCGADVGRTGEARESMSTNRGKVRVRVAFETSDGRVDIWCDADTIARLPKP